MRYTIIINQLAIVENNLDIGLQEAILIDYLYWLCGSPSQPIEKERIFIDGEKYTWVDYNSLLIQMPLLGNIKKPALTALINKLEKKGFIKTAIKRNKKGNKRKYVVLLQKSEVLFSKMNRDTKNPIHLNRLDNINNTYDNINNTSKEVKKTSSSYGREDINDVIVLFRETLEGSPDGSVQENRRFAKLLLDRLKKDYPNEDPVRLIEILLKVGISDSFHSRNLTSVKYLYYNMQKIIQVAKTKGRNKKFVNLD